MGVHAGRRIFNLVAGGQVSWLTRKAKVEKVLGFGGMSGTTVGVEKMSCTVVARSAHLIVPE